MNLIPIRCAVCSVTDKTGLAELAGTLTEYGCTLIASGGTAVHLSEKGMPVRSVSDVTHFPEILDGRVKTLHPGIHAGLLAVRDKPAHLQQLQEHNLPAIDLLIVNLYPFAQTVRKAGRSLFEVIENIDIGGPAMIRAASKNFRFVAVATDPADYPDLIRELRETRGSLSLATRLRLAQKAFVLTSRYDAGIQRYLHTLRATEGMLEECPEVNHFPDILHLELRKASNLRYGENPHQKAALYRSAEAEVHGLPGARILQGKEISYNNLIDLDAAISLVREFQEPAAVIIKHTNPCGTACAETIAEAYRRAHAADPISAFGSIVALNRPLDAQTAELISREFVEALIVPGSSEAAREKLQEKKNLRLLILPDFTESGWRWRSVVGGFLAQEVDAAMETSQMARQVTLRAPGEKEWSDLDFAWRIAKHVKSNAIVLAKDKSSIGVGAGQMSRVESVEIAVRKAGERAKGSVLASDAFFPFRDGIDLAARAGISAIIQPGGSKRDAEVIQAANEHGLAMVFTEVRHFRH